MEPQKLPPAAEEIRIEIKEMIPETATKPIEVQAKLLNQDDRGNKKYGGDLLAGRITRLKEELGINEVGMVITSRGL